MPLYGFDHSPLIINSNVCIPPRPRSFRFEAMWLIRNSCDSVVKNAWKVNISGSSAYTLASKLHSTSFVLSSWNKNEFGNVKIEIQTLQDQLAKLQEDIGPSSSGPVSSSEENAIRGRLEFLLDCEERI